MLMTPDPTVPGEASATVKQAAKRIKSAWMIVYGSWVLFYAGDWFFKAFVGASATGELFLDACAMLNAFLMFDLFVEFSEVTVPTEQGASTHHIQLLVVFGCIAIVLVMLEILAVTNKVPVLITPLRVLAGCISGVTLALVVGRLGSMHIQPGVLILSGLYLYAVIQPFGAMLDRPIVHFLATSVALPLKVLLWMVFVWAATTGRLYEYLLANRPIRIRALGIAS
jgi:hypothetical protein